MKNNLRENSTILGSLIVSTILFVVWKQYFEPNPSVSELVSIVVFVIFYFIVYALAQVFSPNAKKRYMWVLLIGSLFSILFGFTLKINLYLGANIFFNSGMLLFSLAFIPIMVKVRFEKWKNLTSNRVHTIIVSVFDLLSILFICFGILARAQHWFFADYFIYIGVILFGVSFYVWNQIFKKSLRNSRDSEVKLNDALKEITDSINYAKRIQSAILPDETELKNMFAESFILFKPKDIVSGDFYWVAKTEKYYFYATADCTGHGVPGAIMSMLGINFLNEIIVENKVQEPAEVLNKLRDKIIQALKQSGAEGENKDGMDIVLIRINHEKTKLTYSSANNDFYLIRNHELQCFAPDKQPVGFYLRENKPFNQHEISIFPNDIIYTFTDGFADQFGGPKGKKFMYKPLKELLLSNQNLKTPEQREKILNAFINWKGSLEQVDDVCIIGVKI